MSIPDFLERTKELADTYLTNLEDAETVPYVSPERLQQQIDVSIPQRGVSTDALFRKMEEIMQTAPASGSPLFLNQLFGGNNIPAAAAEMLTAVMNNSMYTFKAAGPHILIEQEVIRKVCESVGYRDGDGIFVPGGSLANLVGLLLARNSKEPGYRDNGMRNQHTAYVSQLGHYSVTKSAGIIGIGRRNIRKITTDSQGRMEPDDLRRNIERDIDNGAKPIAVIATAGTTVLGAIDPLEEIRKIADEYDIWMHVDGALGGSILLSSQYRHLLEGAAYSDSFSWNLHKLMSVPLSCSVILTKTKGALLQTFNEDADYLFQTDLEFNPGVKSLQCGRTNDALKAWAAWQYYGDEGFDRRISNLFRLAQYAAGIIKDHPQLILSKEPQTVTVCFEVRGCRSEHICDVLETEQGVKVGYGQVDGRRVIRLVCVNHELTEAHLDEFFANVMAVAESINPATTIPNLN